MLQTKEINEGIRCIRSLRIARLLMQRGYLPIDVEPARRTRGFLIFVFDETPKFTKTLDEIMKGNG